MGMNGLFFNCRNVTPIYCIIIQKTGLQTLAYSGYERKAEKVLIHMSQKLRPFQNSSHETFFTGDHGSICPLYLGFKGRRGSAWCKARRPAPACGFRAPMLTVKAFKKRRLILCTHLVMANIS